YNYGTVSDIGFAQGSGAVLLGYLSCNGDETNLLNCDQNYYYTNTQSHCQSHYYDAAIVCERHCDSYDMRLRDGNTRYGRVEVCISETWTTVCGNQWNYGDASVACRQLGLSPYGSIPLTSYYYHNIWSYGIIYPNCTGIESVIWNCSHVETNNCLDNSDAGVICQTGNIEPVDCVSGDVRLINGTLKSQGRLEVCIGNVWGTVCGRSWDNYDSQVVCKQLGYQRLGASYGYELYGHGSGPILFGYMYCNGHEESLFDCSRNVQSVVSGSCADHYYDIGLKCEPYCENGAVRLQEGTLTSNGRVEICVN
ncbi:PREDICTED: deleted in malignant brain tumors 1 protein-like, partial [Amphimedon queenslandica]|uniref:SRCR domain-containing protein n=1 Tax=Amphimedon queenslandica TaxID=400682 RepID=A0AAN0IU42_AMPQE